MQWLKASVAFVVVLAFANSLASAQESQSGRRRLRPPAVPENVKIFKNLQYGGGTNARQTLDLYVPEDAADPVPVVVWIHGGAWISGSKEGGGPALSLTRVGFAVASINYRLSDEAKFPAQIHDCKAAVRFLRAHATRYRIDPARIGAWGSSAGGHLAALLGTSGGVAALEGDGPHLDQSSAVQAVCDWFGPTDFLQMSRFPSSIDHESPTSPESRLIGGKIRAHPEKVLAANPITYIRAGVTPPPFLIMHGDQDRVVPHNQSELLHDALKHAKADVAFHTVEGGGHGGWRDPALHTMVVDFFSRALAAPSD